MYGSHQSAEQARHPIYLTQIMDSMAATLENELYPTQLSLQEAGYIVSVVIKFGDPAQEILDFAKEEQIDMITMTTHGRTGLNRLIFGSVAKKILHKATIPVMVLRPKI
jgi:nucleotide-binding universal stress UspA family protein